MIKKHLQENWLYILVVARAKLTILFIEKKKRENLQKEHKDLKKYRTKRKRNEKFHDINEAVIQ